MSGWPFANGHQNLQLRQRRLEFSYVIVVAVQCRLPFDPSLRWDHARCKAKEYHAPIDRSVSDVRGVK